MIGNSINSQSSKEPPQPFPHENKRPIDPVNHDRTDPSETKNKQESAPPASFRDELTNAQKQSSTRHGLDAAQQGDGVTEADLPKASQTTASQFDPSPGEGQLVVSNHLAPPIKTRIHHVESNVSDHDQEIRLDLEGDVGDSRDPRTMASPETVDSFFNEEIAGLDQGGSSQPGSTNESALVRTEMVVSPIVPLTSQIDAVQEANAKLALEAGLENPKKSPFEASAPSPNLQFDLPDSSQPPVVSNQEGLASEPSGRFLMEVATRTGASVSTAADTGRAVSQRVSEVIIQEVQLASNNESKQLTLHLHPAELGKLTLQVGWESDSIIAKIVASELATSEMLKGDKTWLIDALQASGVELDSFDISHGDTPYQPDFAQNQETELTNDRPNSTHNQSESNPSIEVDGSLVNLIA